MKAMVLRRLNTLPDAILDKYQAENIALRFVPDTQLEGLLEKGWEYATTKSKEPQRICVGEQGGMVVQWLMANVKAANDAKAAKVVQMAKDDVASANAMKKKKAN